MTDDPITWTGTPDDQRAEWRGMVAIVKRHAQNGALYCEVGTASDATSLFHSADCMLWPEYPVTAKWLCELVMRHEAAKAELANAHRLLRQCKMYAMQCDGKYDADAVAAMHTVPLDEVPDYVNDQVGSLECDVAQWKRRAETWKKVAKSFRKDGMHILKCNERLYDRLAKYATPEELTELAEEARKDGE